MRFMFSFTSTYSKGIALLLLSSLLSACGFHLRDDYDIPEELNPMSLTSYDNYSSLTRLVNAQLRQNAIRIVEVDRTTNNLHLLSESISERTQSLYQNTRTAEIGLTLHVKYRVTVANIGQYEFSTTVTRNYLDNPLTALAKSIERETLEQEMYAQAARQIIRQMARLKVDIQETSADSSLQE